LNLSFIFILISLPHSLRVNFKNFGHTKNNKIFRLVKLLADLSTRLEAQYSRRRKPRANAFRRACFLARY